MGGRTHLKDDFERWAQLSARMLRRPPAECARLVRDAGVDGEWNAADAHWYGVLLDDVEAGRLERVIRFRALCRHELETRIASGALVPSPTDALAAEPNDPTPAFARQLVSRGLRPVEPTRDQEGTRVGLSAAELSAARDAALAAEAPAGEGHDWTVEQYAWLRAELERHPDRADRIWSLRGVSSEASRGAVVDLWERRLGGSHELRARFEELMARYRGMLV